MKFESLHTMLDNARTISDSKAWKYAIDKQTQQYVISLNTHEQLGDDGIDSEGRSLGDYAPLTVQFRRSKGLQVDHIDFKVTGFYWDSWKIKVKSDAIIIEVDRERYQKLVEALKFSPEHVGLTDENMQKLIDNMILNKYIEYVTGILHGD